MWWGMHDIAPPKFSELDWRDKAPHPLIVRHCLGVAIPLKQHTLSALIVRMLPVSSRRLDKLIAGCGKLFEPFSTREEVAD